MERIPEDKFPFSAVPRIDTGRWGVRDRRHQSWAEKPTLGREAAERLAEVLTEAYAAGFADAMIEKAR